MKRSIVVTLGLAAALVAAGLFVSTNLASAAGVQTTGTAAVTAVADSLPRTITVVGQGIAKATPDVAQATIGVEAIATTVAEASTQSNQVMSAIVAAATGLGIAPEDIQTSEYNIYVDASGSVGTTSSPTYHVIQMDTITIRDLSTVGSVIDAAVQAGANRIYGVSFTLNDTADVEANARELAVADALQRAQHLASLVNATVGDVISVSEGAAGGYQPYSSVAKAALDSSGGGTSVSPGQLQFSSSIQIVYVLVPSTGASAAATPGAATTKVASGTPLAAGTPAGTAQPVRTLVTSATLTPAKGAATFKLELAANADPTEQDTGLFLAGWVFVTPDGETNPVQSLDVLFHAVAPGWDKGGQLTGGLDYIITDDINFDGYTDFAVLEPGGATWQVAHWYLYDPQTKVFVTSGLTDQLSLMPWNTYTVDAETRQITFVNMLGATGPGKTVYEVGQDDSLALVSANEGAPTIENGPFSPPPTTAG